MLQIRIQELHPGQQKVRDNAARYNVLECGRRFGKTSIGTEIITTESLSGRDWAWFAPTYKILSPVWDSLKNVCRDAIVYKNEQEKFFKLVSGGSIECWSLDKEDAGRSRKYHGVIIDEAGIVKNLEACWQQAIRPTLSDYQGQAWFLGTPKGSNYFHKLFTKGQSGNPNWKSWRLPTTDNPYISKSEIEDAKSELPEHVFKQEYLGIPAEDGGNPFNLNYIRKCYGHFSTKRPVYFGVDLAKSSDYTWVIGLDEDGCVVLSERWQTNWNDTKERLINIIGDNHALIDSTGVGDPIVEDLERVLYNVQGFKFTSATKQQIMEGLARNIQTLGILFNDDILLAELESFGYEFTRTGVRYSAPEGLHDDGVCALALAVEMKRRCPVLITESTLDRVIMPVSNFNRRMIQC